jgi:hypothetical protein
MSVSTWLESLPSPAPIAPDELEHLRDDLDRSVRDCLDAVGDRLDPDLLPLRLPKGRLADLERCPRSALARFRDTGAHAPGAAALRGTALDQFVTHQLVAGRVREPLADLTSMLTVSADQDSLDALREMGHETATELLDPLATSVAEAWVGIDARWAPRSQSRASLLLAAGACNCSGVVDVELGGAGTGLPGVVIEVKSGSVASAHPHEVYLYALLVALRDRAAPAVVARWYPGADPVGLPVTLGVLEAAAARLAAGARQWAELLAGSVPDERAGGWCGWCPDREVCPSASVDGERRDMVAEPDAGVDEGDDDGW